MLLSPYRRPFWLSFLLGHCVSAGTSLTCAFLMKCIRLNKQKTFDTAQLKQVDNFK